ncbi:MAG: hypothetical protein FJW36_21175 [Acidobacteria bacterium]|nr:hypothetical protein [Acidobacteriota bacterium]
MRVVLRLRGHSGWLRRIETANPVVELTAEEKFRRLVNAALATPYFAVVYVKFCNYEFGQCCLSGLLGEECRGGDVPLLCIQ